LYLQIIGSKLGLLPKYSKPKFITIATNNLHIDELKSHFKGNEPLRTDNIRDFYLENEPGLSNNTINWRVYKLVNEGILERIGRGKFVFGEVKDFQPEVTSELKSLFNKVQKEFPYVKFCIWNSSILNEFMIHQPFRFFTLLEVEKDATESVFHFLKGENKSVFLEPGMEILNNYLPENKTPILVLALVSEAPTQTINGLETPTLEKILVDLFCDTTTFFAYQGSELTTIFKEAFGRYTVHQDRLLRYARRRGKKEKLESFLINHKLTAVNKD